jgi:hypothetical protein
VGNVARLLEANMEKDIRKTIMLTQFEKKVNVTRYTSANAIAQGVVSQNFQRELIYEVLLQFFVKRNYEILYTPMAIIL